MLSRFGLTVLLCCTLFGIRLLLEGLAERYGLEAWLPLGADGWYMADLIASDTFPIYYRSILTVLIHQLIYGLAQPFGITPWYAIALGSSLAGALVIQVLWAFRPSLLFMAVNVLSGAFLVFVGHVENYAWVNLFLIASWLWMRRWMQNQSPLWPAMTLFALACFSHMLALFYTPAIIYALCKNRRYNPYEVLLPVFGFTFLMIVLSSAFRLLGNDNGLERLVPLFSTWAENHHFTLLSWPHIKLLAYFHWRASILGLAADWLILLFLLRRINTPFLRFMFVNVICGLIWTTLWHPDWGMRDWDLFSQFAIPLHLITGLLLCDALENRQTNSVNE